ncbi:class I SAM-dependent methyltransferase [Candidatus Parcubacteria bacterium]|nr:MAG: class I SAM-dependent methyltransferase [Candidatus Parcubacteria bacterium]
MFYFFLSLILLLLLVLAYNIGVYYFTRVPHVRSKNSRLEKIFANLDIKKTDNVYELGCGTAEFLFLAEKYQAAKLYGYELSPLICWYGQIKASLRKSRVKIKCQDFFKVDLKDADIVYLFLVNNVVQKAWQKIKKEVKPGTLVIVLNDEIEGLEAEKVLKFPQTEAKVSFYRV